MAARVARPCQRNDCPAPARAGVELNHGDKVAILVDLPDERDPRRMELCADHASGMSVPLGWTRIDDREEEDARPPQGPPSVTEITSLSTLEVLTAALESDEGHDISGAGEQPADPGVWDPTTPGLAVVPVSDDDAGTTPGAPDPADGPSTAAIMAAVLAHGPHPVDGEPTADPGEGQRAARGDGDPAATADVGPQDTGDADVSDADVRDADVSDADVLEVVTESGTQLVLAEADRMARRARPVPAATDD